MPVLKTIKLLWENIKNIPDRLKKLIELSAADGAIFLDTDGNYRIVPFGSEPGQIAEGNKYLPLAGGNINEGVLGFGSTTRQMINLWGSSSYGLGVQNLTAYMRSSCNYAWYIQGSHSDAPFANSGGYLAFKYDGGTKTFTFSDTTASTTQTSGTVVVAGGIGCNGSVYAPQIQIGNTSCTSSLIENSIGNFFIRNNGDNIYLQPFNGNCSVLIQGKDALGSVRLIAQFNRDAVVFSVPVLANAISGSFTSADGKTVDVTNGIITGIN